MRTYLPARDLELNFETDVGGEDTHWIKAVGLREGEEGLDKPFAGGDPLQRPWNIIADTDEGKMVFQRILRNIDFAGPKRLLVAWDQASL